MDFDLRKLAVGDVVTFRCGGTATIRETSPTDDVDFPIQIKIEGYHAQGSGEWGYSSDGSHAQGTGPLDEYPFDIVKVERQPMIMEKKP